jgi:hypothetical protein
MPATSRKSARVASPAVAKPRPKAKIQDPDLRRLAEGVRGAKAPMGGYPEPAEPRYEPQLWSGLFGLWS